MWTVVDRLGVGFELGRGSGLKCEGCRVSGWTGDVRVVVGGLRVGLAS